jgi:tRNA(Ile)-lysidine synthase
MADSVTLDDLGVARLDGDAFRSVARETGLRALARLLLAIGGDDYPPRSDRLSSLADAIADFPGKGRFKRTLAGAVIEWRQGRFHVFREIGRAGLPWLPLKAGQVALWDRRFEVRAGADLPAGLTVGALGEAGRLEAGALSGEVSAGALAALPAIRRGKALVSVPSLGFSAGKRPVPVSVRPVLGERLTEPPRFPDFAED